MGRSCRFYKKWRVHGAWHPSSKCFMVSGANSSPHDPLSKSRPSGIRRGCSFTALGPCRGLATHLLSHSGPGGCPYHCVIRTGLLVIGRGSSWTFWESYFGNLLGIFAIWESHGNLLGIFCEPSLESRGNLAGISWERRYTSVPTRFPRDSHIWDGRGNEGNERVDISWGRLKREDFGRGIISGFSI